MPIMRRKSSRAQSFRENCIIISMAGNKRRRTPTDTRGFTLVELLIVMVILGLLAAIVAPRFIGKVGGAKQDAARTQIEALGAVLDQFALDTGSYPTTSQGLEALIADPGVEGWDGPYLKKNVIPLDPWNKPYRYRSPGSHGDYDLYSLGKDGIEGGEGENADIKSWE